MPDQLILSSGRCRAVGRVVSVAILHLHHDRANARAPQNRSFEGIDCRFFDYLRRDEGQQLALADQIILAARQHTNTGMSPSHDTLRVASRLCWLFSSPQ